MARAKRTVRADARRRHRAQMEGDGEPREAGELGTDAGEATRPPAAPSVSDARRPGRSVPRAGLAQDLPAPAGGIRNAFRMAFRPLNLREDLALLPRLLANRAFWLPCLITGAVAAVILATRGTELITSQFLSQYFLGPAPMGALFLAGFLAPRASYLIGGLVGLVSAVLTSIVGTALLEPGTGVEAAAIVGTLVYAPITGVFFASAAAWYRRFLHLASPARQMAARRPPPPRGKPARGR